MSDASLHDAAHVAALVARSIAFRDGAGDVVAVFTTWGFAVFGVLLAAAAVGGG